MKKIQRNGILYIFMILLFGGLIYAAINEGKHFDHFARLVNLTDGSSFNMFRNVLIDNLNNPFSILLIQIVVILFAVRLFSFLFKYIGQPGVIGEIVAGIVLGPSLLGYLFPGFFGFLFRHESLMNLQLISQIGLILFMFVIGMELDFSVIKNKINETLVISHAGILVPFFLGILASHWVYEEYASQQTAFLPFALFIGISMSITAFPVLARIIQERNMTKTPIGILSIASAANDDVTAWCLLAVVIAIAKAGTFASALYAIGLTLLYIVVMFFVVRPFLKKVGNVYANKEVINKTFVSFIFLILVISSTLTELIGIHALFGAFIAGVVMPPNFGFRKVMMEKVEDISLVFFLPLFFAFTGLRTEIGLIDSPQLWGLCGLFILVAVVGKFGGCALASRLVGESWKDSLIVGTLMNTRGLMELVALNIGYEMGVLPPSIFVILVIMALVTTFMTTPLLSFVEKAFAKQEKINSQSKKLLFCFGRPETGKDLLSVYLLLFGQQLKKSHLIAAHYTLGTDLNPVKAEQYAKDSFVLVGKEARKLKIPVDKRYKVTDKLIGEMIKLTNTENADLLLVGAGYNFMKENTEADNYKLKKPFISRLFARIGKKSLHLSGTLFKEKLEEIMDNVHCPVAVFVNRNYGDVATVSFLLGGEIDSFLLPYIESVLSNGEIPVKVYLFESQSDNIIFQRKVEELAVGFPDKFSMQLFTNAFDLMLPKESLLFLSYDVCSKLAEDSPFYDSLPSFVAIRPYASVINKE